MNTYDPADCIDYLHPGLDLQADQAAVWSQDRPNPPSGRRAEGWSLAVAEPAGTGSHAVLRPL
jgi:hypothetical protein